MLRSILIKKLFRLGTMHPTPARRLSTRLTYLNLSSYFDKLTKLLKDTCSEIAKIEHPEMALGLQSAFICIGLLSLLMKQSEGQVTCMREY